MKKPEEMSDVELVGYFEGETIAYGTAAAGSKEESDADAHGEAAKAELLRRLGAAVLASAHPRCPMHKTEMVQKINGIPFWVCSTDGCDLFISAEIIKQVAQFFAAAPAQEPRQDLYVISSTGDGAQTIIVPESKLKQSVHDTYCSCGLEWQKCADEVITGTLAKLDDEEEWTREYPGYSYKRHTWGDHGEDYTVTIMRVAAAQEQPVENIPEPPPKKRMMQKPYGGEIHEECPDCRGVCTEYVAAARPSEPSAPRKMIDVDGHEHDEDAQCKYSGCKAAPQAGAEQPFELPGPTGEGSSGHSWIEPAAPQPVSGDAPLRISFDIGGVLSKYPEVFRPMVDALQRGGAEVFVITDMHEHEKSVRFVRENGYDVPAERILNSDYTAHGEGCKAETIKQHSIKIHLDDFAGYCAHTECVNLFVWPNPTKPYYADDFKTDGTEGDFGRRKAAKI